MIRKYARIVAGWLLLPLASCAPVVSEFALHAGSHPIGITAGPDGNLWFTESGGPPLTTAIAGKIGRMAPSGAVLNEFPLPTPQGRPWRITAGPDGNLWFTELDGNKVGRITVIGSISEFDIPTPNSQPQGITAGPDGNLWFREGVGKVGRITTGGTITEFPVPSTTANFGIAAGSDGNLWVTVPGATRHAVIGRVTPSGTFNDFAGGFRDLFAIDIAAGPDANLWFTEWSTESSADGSGLLTAIGRSTPAGVITEFPLLSTSASPFCIAPGPDGNLWFTQSNIASPHPISRITPAGVITEFGSLGTRGDGIAAGPDGNVWFTEPFSDQIGRITP